MLDSKWDDVGYYGSHKEIYSVKVSQVKIMPQKLILGFSHLGFILCENKTEP